jgi:hypothetical protein
MAMELKTKNQRLAPQAKCFPYQGRLSLPVPR